MIGQVQKVPPEVLLIDDDDVDAISVKRAFKKQNIENPLTRKCNGIEGLTYLRERDSNSGIIVLLDLHMPLMNGFEFLQALRSDEQLQETLVVVMSTSTNEDDINKAYACNAAGYICKDNVGKDFENVTRLIKNYGTVREILEVKSGGEYARTVN